MILSTLLKTLLLPPALQIICIILGILLWGWFRRLAVLNLVFGIVSLWCLSLPVVGVYLHAWLEAPYIAETPVLPPEGVDAIVVLGAGRHRDATEYGASEYSADTISHSALWRLRYGGFLANRWDLPVIVSGGNVRQFDVVSEAAMGADFLRNELGVRIVIEEGKSRNTWENAQLSHAVLQVHNYKKVALVTHAYHMRRSAYSFDRAGVAFVPMPTGLYRAQGSSAWWGNWLPSARGLRMSSLALHEYLGLLFYRLK